MPEIIVRIIPSHL